MTATLDNIRDFVWGAPALVLILGVGIWLTIKTGFIQFRLFPAACRRFFSQLSSDKGKEGVSSNQALCTALAATVGTGNIAGVAGAIAIGGPGSIFWMWICGILGMAIKYSEAVLAVRYRIKDGTGEYLGGPMYMISRGLGNRWTWLAVLYSFFGIAAAFGVGNATQVNAVIGGINQIIGSLGFSQSGTVNLAIGLILGILVAAMLLGGARRIGKVAEQLVPLAAAVYILLSLGVLIARIQLIPNAILSIVYGAFHPKAVTGGVIGSIFHALRIGVSRGVFTNEAGMGTASMAHACANTEHPAEQGLMGIMEVFLDTIVICTMTALVILCSGVSVPYGYDSGAVLTMEAFRSVYGGWVNVVIVLELCCFAFATILGWGLYGIRCAQYLLGSSVWKWFVGLQAVTVAVSAILETGTVWTVSEIFNGLMAIPNLVALGALSKELISLTKEYSYSKKQPRQN